MNAVNLTSGSYGGSVLPLETAQELLIAALKGEATIREQEDRLKALESDMETLRMERDEMIAQTRDSWNRLYAEIAGKSGKAVQTSRFGTPTAGPPDED